MILNILYTGTLTFIIMLILHHLYNYLQYNLTIPKVNEIILQPVQPIIEHSDTQYIDTQNTKDTQEKQELKDFLNQFKKK
jgi:hypothetical protein